MDKLEELMSEPAQKRSFRLLPGDKLTGSQRFNGDSGKEAKNNGCYALAPVVFISSILNDELTLKTPLLFIL